MGQRQEGAARRKVENILIGTKEKGNQDKLCIIIALLALVVNSCFQDLGLESHTHTHKHREWDLFKTKMIANTV